MLEGEEIENKSFNRLKEDSISLLCKTRELATLHNVKIFCIESQNNLVELSKGSIEEISEIKGKGDAYQNIIDMVDKEIIRLKNN